MLFTTTLAFMTTFGCNYVCKHCSVNASPDRLNEVITRKIIKKTIDSAYSLPEIKVAVFTGGEPTLHPQLLQYGLQYSHNNGFTTRMVTNAWWASNYKESSAFLDKLYSKGLDEINISYDDFHNEYGGWSRVRNAILASLDIGIKVVVAIVEHKFSKITGQSIMDKIKKDPNIDANDIIITSDSVHPLGRGKKLDTQFLIQDDKHNLPCKMILKSISILPNGNVMACCGHIVSEPASKYLMLGNILIHDLNELIKKARRNILFWWLFFKGPFYILNRINGDVSKSHSICQHCYSLLSKYMKELIHYIKKENILFSWKIYYIRTFMNNFIKVFMEKYNGEW